MPLQGTSVRRGLDAWLDSHGIRVNQIGEFADSALIKVFGQNDGCIFAPTAISDEVVTQFRCHPIAEIPEVAERYYAIGRTKTETSSSQGYFRAGQRATFA